MLLAQADPTWFSVLIQGGSFALIAYIVTVMWPRHTRDAAAAQEKREEKAKEEREDRDNKFLIAIGELNKAFAERSKEATDAAGLQAKLLASAVNTQSETLAKEVKVQNDLIVAALQNVCKLKEPE